MELKSLTMGAVLFLWKLATLMGQSDHLAAELVELGAEYDEICEDDFESGEEFHKCFKELHNSKSTPNSFQYEKLCEIRDKLERYNTLLLQVAELLHLKPPSKKNIGILREWLSDVKGGDEFLQGTERFQWDPAADADLVALHKTTDDEDIFTRIFRKTFVHVYHRLWGHKGRGGIVIDEESGMIEYSDSKIGQVTQALSTTLASVLPLLAVLALYFEKNLLNRIYIMIGITTVFAAILSVFSRASRVEIFSATATFAAVEVVFIGSTST